MFRENQQIGNYVLIKLLGRGGFGEVWLAENRTTLLTKKVAVKLPLDSGIDLETVRREANLWEQASGNANVLPIIEANIYDGQIAIVSEYTPDGSLADLLKNYGRLQPEVVAEIGTGILSGLEYLHSKRIIHRDLKPANILLQGRTPRLTDFGISHLLRTTSASKSDHIKGTFAYMPLEAFDGVRSEKVDIWSFGVVLYEMLSGNLPFPQPDVVTLLGALNRGIYPPLPNDVPPELQRIIAKCLAPNPAQRSQTAREVRMDLERELIRLKHPTAAPTDILKKTRGLDNPNPPQDIPVDGETIIDENPPTDVINPIPPTAEELAKKTNKTSKSEIKIVGMAVGVVALFLLTMFGLIIISQFLPNPQNKTATNSYQIPNSTNTKTNNNTIWNEMFKDYGNNSNTVNSNSTNSNTKTLVTAEDNFWEGLKFQEKKDLEQAIRLYTRCLELDAKKYICYNNRGIAYRHKGEFDQAIADATKVLEFMPSDATYYDTRGKAYLGKKDYAKAIEDYNKAIKLDSTYAYGYVGRGNAYSETGKLVEAVTDYCKALSLDKFNQEAKRGLAQFPNVGCK